MRDGNWNCTTVTTEAQVFEMLLKLQGDQWLCRGHPQLYGRLVPSIDRGGREHLSRLEKLSIERRSIELFRSTARFFAQGEEQALRDDFVTLMVLRHYGVPTRLLDWSSSPFVAAYFAVSEDDSEDGEIWAFDRRLYEERGAKQWELSPETKGGDGQFAAGLTAFTEAEPVDSFSCAFYSGFPRQSAQKGAYSVTARFGLDHAQSIAALLEDNSRHHHYLVPSKLKIELRKLLRDRYDIWRGSLFPNSAGAAETVRSNFVN